MLEVDILLILILVAFIAGFVDSIAGGGGIITIPALLLAGIPPHYALGTNKLQSSFGSFSATIHFYRKGHLKIKENLPFIISVGVFASIGTILIQFFDANVLSKFIPFLLIIFSIYFLFSPKIKEENSIAKLGKLGLALILGVIGFYDGFFGPGTGSFLMFALILFGGFGIKESLAQAKLYNFTTNIASVIFFAIGGHILYKIGLAMAVGQFLGAYIGSKVALKYGIKIIKPLVVIVSILASINLLSKQYFNKSLLEIIIFSF
ncbi:TSUP family transporter [Helicobacter sp. MIT 14-3879]|uniref:TSUP family transporter n=1 Tax=Helicobacter sp. MIT 14-3879 TaxID=2040649 RepID=UPI000E1E6A56|nr:TSUP family transporter [Helicobacter sp. MIT 14-3879]RDU65166.1 hypothetical protein CQA44_02310 [Helicobacter sp. MIT 14-3879]